MSTILQKLLMRSRTASTWMSSRIIGVRRLFPGAAEIETASMSSPEFMTRGEIQAEFKAIRVETRDSSHEMRSRFERIDEKFNTLANKKDYTGIKAVGTVLTVLAPFEFNRIFYNRGMIKGFEEEFYKEYEKLRILERKLQLTHTHPRLSLIWEETGRDPLKYSNREALHTDINIQLEQLKILKRKVDELDRSLGQVLWLVDCTPVSLYLEMATQSRCEDLQRKIDEQIQRLMISTKFNEGIILYRQEDFLKAKKAILDTISLISSIKCHPNDNANKGHEAKYLISMNWLTVVEASAYNLCGVIQRGLDDFENKPSGEALKFFEKAHELRPHDPYILSNIAFTKNTLKLHKESFSDHYKAWRQNPNDPATLNGLAYVTHLLGDYKIALMLFELALMIGPNNKIILNNITWLLLDMRRQVEALCYAKKALKLSPYSSTSLYLYATALYDNHNYKEAEFHFKLALKYARGKYKESSLIARRAEQGLIRSQYAQANWLMWLGVTSDYIYPVTLEGEKDAQENKSDAEIGSLSSILSSSK